MFRRKNRSEGETSETPKPKSSWRKPANTAFRQQRLKAWQPILTPKTVLPTLFLIGIIFAPIGGLLIWGSNQVSEITLDYTNCDTQAPSVAFAPLPNYNYDLRSSDKGASYTPPAWEFSNFTDAAPAEQHICTIQFDVPADMKPPVFLYYKMTNFYQNHRRYVKSYDPNQLKGKYVSASTLNNGDCKPLGVLNGLAVYPCGLIANSVFNDTFSQPVLQGNETATYNFTDKGIAWPGEAKKYTNTPGYTNLSEIVPPPNWVLRYGTSYNSSNIPQLASDEHFQNWMRTAGLPTFTKLYFRNDHETLIRGRYSMQIAMNFPVTKYSGTKSIVISTVSWIGGKNTFMGWAYIATAALFIALGVAGTIRHMLSPRKLGDMSLLSWNQPPPAATVPR